MTETGATLPLFDAYPGLREAIAWVSIGEWPTPVQHARNFGRRVGLPNIYVKREDMSHPECGGNKTRGLEFLLAEAQRRGTRTIVTFSSVGSHHICRTAWHAARLDIRTVAIVMNQPNAQYVRSHLLWGLRAGARYIPANFATVLPKGLYELLRLRNREGGHMPLLIPPGGTSPMACLGHVNAAFELAQQVRSGQLPEPDFLYVPLGSLGTAAGLALGCKLAGLRTRVIGVVVSYRWYCTAGRVARLARRTRDFMWRADHRVPDVQVRASDLSVVSTALGSGYAWFTREAAEWSCIFRDEEGLCIDGTYGGKALDGALRFIRQLQVSDHVHLFWHTYHPLPYDDCPASLLSTLDRRLRRYFEDPVQPLDDQFRDRTVPS